ncbi:MAG TPA: AbrB/MazE/SpoVT family DNA-binding domain-containing protein [Verrucomicrobiae bacterium]|nr:AbrB/MazE/SpoVT family DNA-binding domain-containing protein [Verrucomicrobiae bacterium]
MEEVLVTRKGQITVPISLRRKYGIKEGMKITVEDSGSNIVLKVVPRFEDLIGIDAGKIDLEKAIKKLDKMRSEDRY